MICHSHKFIFIHQGKCAGTSIKRTLARDNPDMVYEYTHHKSLSDVLNGNENLYNDYLKVCSVRDPWDRQVSWYHHLDNLANYKVPTFSEWMSKEQAVLRFCDIEDFDFYIKYENLEKDYQKFCDKVGLDNNGLLKIDHFNKRPNIKYSEYYNESSIEFIAKKNKSLIDMFCYKFKY